MRSERLERELRFSRRMRAASLVLLGLAAVLIAMGAIVPDGGALEVAAILLIIVSAALLISAQIRLAEAVGKRRPD